MPQFNETPEEIQSEIEISKGMSLRGRNRADIPISQILDYLRRTNDGRYKGLIERLGIRR